MIRKSGGTIGRIALARVLLAGIAVLLASCGGGGGSSSSVQVTMSLSASAVSSTAIHLSWTPATVAPNYYAVYMDGTKLGNVYSGTSITPGNLDPDSRYCFLIGAVYFPFGVLEQSNQVCVATPVDLPPAAPSSLNAIAISPAQVDLDWNASSDDYGVAGYFVYRDGARVAQVSDIMASDTSLDPARQYCYQVSAYDAVGNESAKSTQVCVTTPDDTQPPTTPQNLSAIAVNKAEINVSWSASTDNGVVRGYRLSRNGVFIVDSASTDYTDVSVSPATQYCYEVAAYDAGGNQSGVSAEVCVSTGWTLTTVDSQGDVGAQHALGLDLSGHVHIGYLDGTFVGSGQQVDDLKYATDASGTWVISVLDSDASAQRDIAIAMDAGDGVHLSYSSVSGFRLMYATTATGSWTTELVSSDVNSGNDSSIATDSLGKVHISHRYDGLEYVTNTSGTWQTEDVDVTGAAGIYNALSIDSAGTAHIAYYDLTSGDVKYAANMTGSWVVEIIDTPGQYGYGMSLAVDSSDKVHICYHDSLNGTLKYASGVSGAWSSVVVDSAGSVGSGCSIAIDSLDKAHISYIDETSHDLRYVTNASGAWQVLTVDNVARVAGETSLAVDVSGNVHISYYGDTKLLYATNR